MSTSPAATPHPQSPLSNLPPPFIRTPEAETWLAAQTEVAAARYTLQLIAQAQCALYFLDAQLLYVKAEDGVLHSKFISTEGAREAFSYEAFDSHWLPPRIRRWGHQAQGRWAVQFTSPANYEIELPAHPTGPEEMRAPLRLRLNLPGLVFMGMRNIYRLWAIAESEFDPHALIYHAPLPNIYSDGRICFGANTPPEVVAPNLDQAWDLFLRSPYTCAHTSGRSLAYPEHICPALIAYAQRADPDAPYPVEDMCPYNLTVSEAVERVISGQEIPAQVIHQGPFT